MYRWLSVSDALAIARGKQDDGLKLSADCWLFWSRWITVQNLGIRDPLLSSACVDYSSCCPDLWQNLLLKS